MKKLLVFIICLTLFIINARGQNLVPNGDFETYSQCPTFISQVEQCTNWIQPTNATPDYFHSCATYISVLVPGNFAGFQYPKSGNAYIGFFTYEPASIDTTREYVEVELLSPLLAGSCYYFEMYTNLANRCIYNSYDVGVYFTDTLLNGLITTGPLPFIPQIENVATNPFDTVNWTKVSGTYIASGGEQYLIIGNFYDNAQTHPVMYNPNATYGTYLYIDDVSLTVCTGMEEFNKLDIVVAPNPFTEKLTITAKTNELYELKLTDIAGRQVLKQNLQGNATVQTGSLGKGVYFATLRKREKAVTVKVVKQ